MAVTRNLLLWGPIQYWGHSLINYKYIYSNRKNKHKFNSIFNNLLIVNFQIYTN